MAKGGVRPGAGRRPGIKNRKTVESMEAVKASGLTPLDYMLSILRDENAAPDARFSAATAAAPYCHPRLAAIEHSGELAVTHEAALNELDGEGEEDPPSTDG